MNSHQSSEILVRKLGHDVGKYISRAARNMGDTPLSQPLLDLLIEDLFALDGNRRASLVFEDIAAPLEAFIGINVHIGNARALLLHIDALESDLRSGDNPAIKTAVTLALRVEREIGLLAEELNTITK
jgi:hypothetical protein